MEMIKRFYSKHQDSINSHFQTFVAAFVATFLADGIMDLTNLYNGDFSNETIYAICAVVIRSVVKAIFQTLLPGVFKKRVSVQNTNVQ